MRIYLILFLFLFCTLCTGKLYAQNGKYNSKLNELLSIQDNGKKADSLEKFLKATLVDDPQTGKRGAKELLILAAQLNKPRQKLTAYNMLGLSLYYLGESNVGVFYLDTLLKNAKQQNDTLMQTKAFVNLGLLHERLGNYDQAYSNDLLALKAAERNNNKSAIASSSGNLGNVCVRLKKYKEAIIYLEQSAKMYNALGNKKGEANQYNSLGVVYNNQNLIDKEILYYYKAEKIYREIGSENDLATVLTNISANETEKKNYKKALDLGLEAAKLKSKFGDKHGEAVVVGNIAGIYAHLNDFENAFKSVELAEAFFKKEEDVFALAEIKKKRALINELAGNHEQATKELREFNLLKDSAIGIQTQLAVTELQQKYEVEKKDLQLKLQTSEINEQKQKSLYTKIIFSVALVAILLIALVVYIRIKQKQKIQSEIEKIKQENLLQQKEVETKEKERNRMAAELHDNVGSSVSFISVKIDWLLHHQNLNEESKKELSLLKNSAQEVMSGLRETLWTLNAKSISNFDFCDKLKVYIKKHLLCECVITDTINEEYIIPNEDVLALYRCCQEIINNINKHSKATKVCITFISDKKTKLGIITEDNGVGFTESEKEESYGLRNIKARMSKINAEVSILSKINEGTRIELKY